MSDNTYFIANEIEKYISDELVGKYTKALSQYDDCKAILSTLKRLENRSKEFHDPSFVVLVVGPVKSGKSTFVNLVANKYVSPTHFLECTIRPSIISAGEKKELTIYRSLGIDAKAEQMNDILDCLNGLIDKDDIAAVSVQTVPLNEENIEKYVRLDLGKVIGDEILLTSITTDGGHLLQDNVFLVDMAGFDGAHVGLDATYETIIERADLIVFVQSSNSAISKVSSNFFQIMRDRNTTAPVCLVHNVFESAYWRTDEQKIHTIESQKKHAIEAIRNTYGLLLDDENAFNLNLGKVYDLRCGNYVEKEKAVLATEEAEFVKAEEMMYRLFSRRGDIRMRNCISRTAIQQRKLLGQVQEVLNMLSDKWGMYEKVSSEFEALKISKNNMQYAFDSRIELKKLKEIAELAYNDAKCDLQAHKKYTTEEARQLVVNFLAAIQYGLDKYLREQLRMLGNSLNSEQIQTVIAAINTKASQNGVSSVVTLNVKLEERFYRFDHHINIQQLIPKKFMGLSKYNQEDLLKKLTYVKDKVYGFPIPATKVNQPGLVETEVYPSLCGIIETAKRNYIERLISSINIEIDRLKMMALGRMIPDVNQFNSNLELMKNFNNAINTLKI